MLPFSRFSLPALSSLRLTLLPARLRPPSLCLPLRSPSSASQHGCFAHSGCLHTLKTCRSSVCRRDVRRQEVYLPDLFASTCVFEQRAGSRALCATVRFLGGSALHPLIWTICQALLSNTSATSDRCALSIWWRLVCMKKKKDAGRRDGGTFPKTRRQNLLWAHANQQRKRRVVTGKPEDLFQKSASYTRWVTNKQDNM